MGIERFGCVRFDSDDPNRGGWVSVGGKRAHRISSVGSLDNETLWWTNLSFRAMYEANLHKTPFIKRSTYLNSWLQDGQLEFCQAWGFLRRTHTEEQITAALAAVFDRTMRFAGCHYGIDYTRSVPVHDNLADELRCRLLPQKDEHTNPQVDSALWAAHQYYAYCLTPHYNKEEMIHVRFAVPAVAYAREMLDAVIPNDQVEYVSAEQMPPESERVDWILNQPRPALVRVTVSNIHPDYVNVVAFANGAKAGNNRGWVTHPELIMLARYAQIEVGGAYLYGAYTGLPEKCLLPSFSVMQTMTPTAEILSSNHWIGLARENCYRLEPKATEHRMHSARGAWLCANDRLIMFTYALQLHGMGIVVRKYGAGAVTVVVPKHNYREVYERATKIGLLAPPTLINDIEVQDEMVTDE